MLSNNEIMVLNDAIYKIHTTCDFDEMRIALLRSLEFIIPSPLLTFYMADPDNPGYLADPVGIAEGRMLDPSAPKPPLRNSKEDPLEVSLQNYLDEYEEIDYTRWVFSAPFAKVYRETDFMSDEERMQTEYYKRMYLPDDIHYSVILVLNYQGTFLGCVCLYRRKKAQDFSEKEMMMLDLLKDHLSYRLALERADVEIPGIIAQKAFCQDRGEIAKECDLTRREEEILNMLLDGSSREDICEKLCIAPNTLKKHTMHIYKKLGVKSWRELFYRFQDN